MHRVNDATTITILYMSDHYKKRFIAAIQRAFEAFLRSLGDHQRPIIHVKSGNL